jgi:hypothetical protein
MMIKPEDYAMRRVGFGLVIMSAFISAIILYALWMGLAQ